MSVKFSFRFGMTVNVGDYSNVRPELGFEDMEIPAGEDAFTYILANIQSVMEMVHAIADDELEAHGRNAQYSGEMLYSVRVNDLRQCILMYPSHTQPPEERNWKERDHWEGGHVYLAREFPGRMREATARDFCQALFDLHPDYQVVYNHSGLFYTLPPLPDPGPEPIWHQKDLKEYLGRHYLNIPEEEWETVATLDYVDKNYLSLVYESTRSGWNTPAQLNKADALAFILENRPFPAAQAEVEPEPEEEDDWDDAYEEDYDED